MTIQTINIGAAANDGNGDAPRQAGEKLNSNFTNPSHAASKILLGVVSQSGGTPTGAIIERGSNANGEFTRFADGTLICWFVDSSDITTATAKAGGFTVSKTLTFPSVFATAPQVSPNCYGGNGFAVSNNLPTATDFIFEALTLVSGIAVRPNYTAVGRWF